MFLMVPRAATLEKIKETQEEMQRGQEEMQREQKKQRALLLTIKKLSAENKTELRRTREVLMKGIFEATEVSKPTTFIVLKEELPEPTSEEEKEQLHREELLAQEQDQLQVQELVREQEQEQ